MPHKTPSYKNPSYETPSHESPSYEAPADDVLRSLNDRVIEFLVQLDLPPDQAADGPFLIRFGSTVVMVKVFLDGTDPYIRITATVLKDFRPNLELITRILRLNTEVLFGAFLLFEDDVLVFATTLLGTDITLPQFHKAIDYTARVADDYDDELQTIAGGRRAEEIIGGE